MMRAFLGCAAFFGCAGSALAAPISCAVSEYDASKLVQGTQGCERLVVTSSNKTNDKDGVVGSAGFFQIDSWELAGKYDNLDTKPLDDAPLFDFSGDHRSGAFSFVGNLNANLDIMLVFKSGKGTNLIAYLLDDLSATKFTYASPFVSEVFGSDKDISHISVYTSPRRTSGNTGDQTGGGQTGDTQTGSTQTGSTQTGRTQTGGISPGDGLYTGGELQGGGSAQTGGGLPSNIGVIDTGEGASEELREVPEPAGLALLAMGALAAAGARRRRRVT